jgi:hypothetical protein
MRGATPMNDYPMLHILVRWGRAIAIALACLVAAAGIWAALAQGNYLWGLLGLGLGAIGYGLLLSYVELVKLVMDMLLPK